MSLRDKIDIDALPRMPGKQIHLEAKTRELLTGDINEAQFLDYLNLQRRKYQAMLDGITEDQRDEQLTIMFKEAHASAQQGVHAHLQAMELLELWMGSRDRSTYQQAMALTAQGDTFFDQCLRDCLEVTLSVDETVVEVLAAMGATEGEEGNTFGTEESGPQFFMQGL